jgi:flagellar biosynthesis/type III secretory pathway protein FliH
MIIRLPHPLENARLIAAVPAVVQGAAAVSPLASPVESAPSPAAVAAKTPDAICSLLESVQERLVEMESRRQHAMAEFRELAIELAIAAAQKAVQGTIAESVLPLGQIVDQMLKKIVGDEPLTIFVHPADWELVQSHLAKPAGDGNPPGPERMSIQPRPGLARGSCLVSAPQYSLFFDTETYLAELRQSLLENSHASEIERRAAQTANSRLQRFPDRRSAG